MASPIEKLVEEIRGLPLEQQEQLRNALDAEVASARSNDQTSELEFKQRLLQAGLITEIREPARDRASFLRYQPVAIQGKPLSETIIEERR
jgi:hypothetical protein